MTSILAPDRDGLELVLIAAIVVLGDNFDSDRASRPSLLSMAPIPWLLSESVTREGWCVQQEVSLPG